MPSEIELPSKEEQLRKHECARFEAAISSGDATEVQRGIDLGLLKKELTGAASPASGSAVNVIGASKKPIIIAAGSRSVAELLISYGVSLTATEPRGSRGNVVHAVVDRIANASSTTASASSLSLELLEFLVTPSAKSTVKMAQVITLLSHKNQGGLVPVQLAARVGAPQALQILVDGTMKLLQVLHEQQQEGEEEKERTSPRQDDDDDSNVLSPAQMFVQLRQTLLPLLHLAAMFGSAASCSYLLGLPRELTKKRDEETNDDETASTTVVSSTVAQPEQDFLYHIDAKLGKDIAYGPHSCQPLCKYDADCTAVHIAAVNGHAEVVKLFVSGHVQMKADAVAEEKERKHRQWLLGRAAHEASRVADDGDSTPSPATPRATTGDDSESQQEPTVEDVSPIKKDDEATKADSQRPSRRDSAASPQEKQAVSELLPEEENNNDGLPLTVLARAHLGDVHALDRMGSNALHYAAECAGKTPMTQNTDVILLLLEVAPDALAVQNRGGRTPLEAALRADRKVNAQVMMQFRQENPEDEKKNIDSSSITAATDSDLQQQVPKRIIVSGIEIDISTFTHTHLKDAVLTRDVILAGAGAASRSTVVGNPSRPSSIAAAAHEQSVSTLVIDHKSIDLNNSGLGSLAPAVAASKGDSTLWQAHTRGVRLTDFSSSPTGKTVAKSSLPPISHRRI